MIRVQVVDHPMVRRCVRAMLDHAEGGVPPLQALVAAAARLGALTAALDRLRLDGRA